MLANSVTGLGPLFTGRQWKDAEEMDDETDEPYLLGLL